METHLDLLLALLHRELQLLLPVLQREDLLGPRRHLGAEAAHLELHDVVVDEDFLLLPRRLVHHLLENLVLQLELIHLLRRFRLVVVDTHQRALGLAELGVLLLVLIREDGPQRHLLLQVQFCLLQLPRKVFLLLQRPLSGHPRDLSSKESARAFSSQQTS